MLNTDIFLLRRGRLTPVFCNAAVPAACRQDASGTRNRGRATTGKQEGVAGGAPTLGKLNPAYHELRFNNSASSSSAIKSSTLPLQESPARRRVFMVNRALIIRCG
jgi:hypothetical protein